jgi:hypothetical protein
MGGHFGTPAGCNWNERQPDNCVSIHPVIAGLDPAIHQSS